MLSRYKYSFRHPVLHFAAMHLILALSVIILQHVDSYSCRSILRTVENLNTKSIEDSSESYELRNEDIMELLQPFLEPNPEEMVEKQQLQRNLAKLTIEPYLKKNRTRQGQRNPFSNLNKRKTIAPLAIILTNLPDLKLKQAGNNIEKEKNVNEKVNENNLYNDSEDLSNKILYHLLKADQQKQNSDEITNINSQKDEYISPQVKSNEEKLNSNILDIDETFKPVTSNPVEVITGSRYPISIEEKDLNNYDNNEEYGDTFKSEVKAITKQLANEDFPNESASSTEGVKSSKDDYLSDDYTLFSEVLKRKDQYGTAEDKFQNVVGEVSKAHDSLAEDKQLDRDLNLHNIDAGDMNEEDYDRINNSLDLTKNNLDFGSQKLKISNQDRIIPDPNKALSKEDDKENVFASQQEYLHNLQKDILLKQESNKEDSIETLGHLKSSEENTVIELSEKLSKEYRKENSQSHPKYLHILLEEDEDINKEYTEENPQKHLHNIQKHIPLETDKELSKEDANEKSIKDHQKHLHSLQNNHENQENWHHDIDDGYSSVTHKIYNLYFRFQK